MFPTTFRNVSPYAALLATLLPAVAQVEAQEPTPAADSDTIQEVTVTARRREESLQDVPIAVSAFSAEQLERIGALDITTLQQTTPNLTLQVARGSNSTLIAFIRGVGQQDPLWGFEPGVGLYVDDVYVARPQGAVLDIYDIERIEVLRGPQGTLYGRNTIGGAIKYVTRRLGEDPALSAKVNLGSYSQRDVIVTGSTPVGAGGLCGRRDRRRVPPRRLRYQSRDRRGALQQGDQCVPLHRGVCAEREHVLPPGRRLDG